MQSPPVTPTQRPPEWVERNWKWFVPVVGVTLVLVVAGFIVAVGRIMKSSPVYSEALARAKASAEVVAALGTPIQDGVLFTGNVDIHNDSGHAKFEIPITGPTGRATIYAVSSMAAGEWHFDQLVVYVVQSDRKINLLESRPGQTSGQTKSPPPAAAHR